MEIDKYNEFIELDNKGIKKEAKQALCEFINSFSSFEEKEKWTYEYLPNLETNHHSRIRHELYDKVIFPVLLDGFRKRQVNAMHWIVKTMQNLYSAQNLYKEIDYKTDVEIIKECYEIEPFNSEVKDTFLEIKIRYLSFSQHEWPSGILYGMDGATLEECYEIKDTLPLIRELDKEKKYEEYINEYESKLEMYIERLKSKL